MEKKPIIVDFEGLDCSFKETNSKKLAEHLHGKRYEFPDYSSESSYFIRQYLSGKYSMINNKAPIMMAYLMEMFDVWHTKVVPDIKNGLEVVVFDRFWYSNYYYQCESTKDKITLQLIANELGLPKCDILFKMMTNFSLTIEKIREKNNRDILELDEEKLKKVHCDFSICDFNRMRHVYNILTYDDDGFRNPDEIFSEIALKYSTAYNEIQKYNLKK